MLQCNLVLLRDQEGSTFQTVIKEVVEAKDKADKTIALCLLRMYFHDRFVHMCERTMCPNRSRRVMLWLVKYQVNFKASQLDTWII